jgi:putative oxidoreductase
MLSAKTEVEMKRYGFLALRVLLALAFLGAGWGKLSGDPMMVKVFASIGIGQWFRYLTGGIEVVSAIGLLPSATAGIAALLLTCTMIGGALAHLVVLGGSPAPAVVLGLLSAVVAFERYQNWKNPA